MSNYIYWSSLAKLNVNDMELKTSLKACVDYKQIVDVLNNFESSLDKQLEDLNDHVDGQTLLDELHRYNDIKDMTQILIGSLAIIRGVTAIKIHSDFSLDI